jgi:hypothetical protein
MAQSQTFAAAKSCGAVIISKEDFKSFEILLTYLSISHSGGSRVVPFMGSLLAFASPTNP